MKKLSLILSFGLMIVGVQLHGMDKLSAESVEFSANLKYSDSDKDLRAKDAKIKELEDELAKKNREIQGQYSCLRRNEAEIKNLKDDNVHIISISKRKAFMQDTEIDEYKKTIARYNAVLLMGSITTAYYLYFNQK